MLAYPKNYINYKLGLLKYNNYIYGKYNSMRQHHLGEFEEIVLLIVAILQGRAYSVSIITEIESRLNRKVSLGAIQTVLKRLETKGLLESEFGIATSVRGGKKKRLYDITTKGKQLLSETKAQRNSLWDAIPNLAFKFA